MTWRRRIGPVAVLVVILAILAAAIARPAAATPSGRDVARTAPTVLTIACQRTTNGFLWWTSSTAACPAPWHVVTFSSAAPVRICVHPGYWIWKPLTNSTPCTARHEPGGYTALTVPAATDKHFCAPIPTPWPIRYVVPATNALNTTTCYPGGKPLIIPHTTSNHPPTNIGLSNATVPAGSPSGTTVGTLSTTDADAGDSFTYSLVSGTGSTDNGSFQIVGTQLRTSGVATAGSKHIRIRTNDGHGGTFEKQFTITVTATGPGNHPPTDIQLSNSSVPAGSPSGTTVGTLTTTDPDAGDTFTYTLVAGSGSTDNTSFQIVGNELRTNGAATAGTKHIRIRTTDNHGGSYEEAFTITVTTVNQAPVVTTSGGDASYTEGGSPVAVDPSVAVADDSAQLQGATVSITGNFAAADGDSLNFTNQNGISGSYNSGTGVLTLSGNSSVANYQSALRSVTFSNTSDTPSTATRSVSFQVTDSSAVDSNTATRGVTVAASNDAPVVTTSSGDLAYTEGDPATAVDPSLTVSDADDTNLEGAQAQITTGFESGDALAFTDTANITGSFDPSTGALTLSGTDTVANYEAALRSVTYQSTRDNPSTPKSVEFKVNDGDVDSNTAAKGIAVTNVNDPPTLTTSSGSASYTEDGSPAQIDPSLTAGDPDSGQFQGGTVAITSNFSSADGDTLNFTNQAGITGSYDSGTGVLTLSGATGIAAYETALRSITFSNTSDTPSTATRTVSFKVTDTDGADSNTATRDVTVAVSNDAPVVTTSGGDTAYTEGDPATPVDGSLTVSDADDTNLESGQVRISAGFDAGDSLNFSDQNGITGLYDAGTGVLTLSGTASVADYQTALRSIQYVSTNTNPATSKTVEFKVNDGDVDSNLATKGLAITPVNQDPTAVDDNTSLDEDSGTVTVPVLANDTDPEGDPITIAAVGAASNGVVTIDGDQIRYQPNANFCGSDSFTYTINGGSTATVSVTVNCVNDAPTLSGVESSTLAVDSGPIVSPATNRITDSIVVGDIDNADLDHATISIANGLDTVHHDTLHFTDQNGITGSYAPGTGVLTLSGATTPANYQTALRSITFTTDSAAPDGDRTVSFTVNDGSLDSNTATRDIHVTHVDAAPVANDDTIDGTSSAVGNTTLVVNDPTDDPPATPDPTDTSPVTDRPHKTVTGNILGNDTDTDGPGPLVATPGTFPTNDGGSVTIEADGDFTFEPAPSTSCSDTSDFFDYTVSDQDPTTPKTDVGRVTIAISGCVWYVNNDDAQGNSGTSQKPFDTLAQAQTASGTGDTIFVYDGNDTTTGYNAGINLKTNQTLLSEAADLVVGSDTLHTADAANKATITNNNADVVSLNGGTSVKGLNIDPQGTGGGICGGTACGGNATASSTLDDINIVDNGTKGTQPGLELNGTTGTFNISNLTVNNGDGSSATSTDEGVKLNNAGIVNFASTGTISITTNGAPGLDAAAGGGTTSLGTASAFDDITVTNSGNGGVLLSGTTGSGTAFGDGSGNDLQLTTVSGAAAGFSAQTAGSFSVPSAGQSDVSATGGPAVDVASSAGSTMAFDGVSSTNSANDGINIDSLGSGTFSATSGTIGGEAGIGFDLNGGSGAITYPGTFNNGSGPLVAEVTGRTGGVVSLSGNLNDTNDAGGGLNVANDTGGSTVFSGATKQFNTGASDAVTFSNSDGHTLVLSGGGLAIATTSGNGINATTSGTFQVSGSGNTIDSTALGASNRGLNISDTDISATGVTFQHISTSGGTNGIRLNNVTGNTGGQGALTVTGTGAAASGGTVTGASGPNVSLTTATNSDATGYAFSGDRMNITSGADDGISATGVGTSAGGGIKLSNSTVSNNGDAAGESGLDGSNLVGHVDLSTDTFSADYDSGVHISNDSGTLNANVQGGTIQNILGNAGAGDGIQVQGTNTGAQNLTVNGVTFSNNKDSHVQSTSDSANTTGTNTVNITNNTMSEPSGCCVPPATTTLGGGITVNHGGNSVTHTTITGNNIQWSTIGAIAIDTTGSVSDQQHAAIDATIQNNTIGTSGQAGSGSTQGNGIFVSSNGAGHVKALITGNTVKQWTNRNGLELDDLDGPAQLDATVHGNTFTEPNSAFAGTTTRGFTFQLGAAQAGDNIQACLDIGGAGALANQVAGDGESPQPDIRWLYEGPSSGGPSAVTLANYSGPSSPAITDIASYLQPRNAIGGTPTVTGTAVPTGTHSVTSVASCPQPSP